MNGIDTSEFSPNDKDRNSLRDSLGIREGEFLLMTSGSISKEKGHHIAVEALNKLLKENKKFLDKIIDLKIENDKKYEFY